MNARTIYLRIDVTEMNPQYSYSDYFTLSKTHKAMDNNTFINNFDYNQLASLLTNENKKYLMFAGETVEEAKSIACGHSFYFDVIIVGVTVPCYQLEDEHLSEKDLYPSMLNATSRKCLILKRNTEFTVENIISIHPMLGSDYRNSYKNIGTEIEEMWPEGLTSFTRPGAKEISALKMGLFYHHNRKDYIIPLSEVSPLKMENFKEKNNTELSKSLISGLVGF